MIPSLLRPSLHTSTTNTAEEDPFSILSTSLTTLYPEETTTSHGDPGSKLTYTSTAFGDIELELPNPSTHSETGLFAHYVWNAGIVLAEAIGGAWECRERERREGFWERDWREAVRGRAVIEVGAGSGVLSIVCSLAGAREVVCTDYPSDDILGAIGRNVKKNLEASGDDAGESAEQLAACHEGEQDDKAMNDSGIAKVQVYGHKWGHFDDKISQSRKEDFDIVIAADTLWIGAQHETLLSSVEHFLSTENPDAEAWIIAGFHTGRAKIAGFIDLINDTPQSHVDSAIYHGAMKVASIWEIDVDGTTRDWIEERPGEDITSRKRWCVMIVLRRR